MWHKHITNTQGRKETKNKSKIEEETIANMSTGWRKSKMSESLVRELESMGLLQEQGVSQWRTGEGEDWKALVWFW